LPGLIPTGLHHSAQLEYSRRSSVCTPGSIPTGLHHSAQGCPRWRTTLGTSSPMIFNPNGVVSLHWCDALPVHSGVQAESVRKRSPALNMVVPGHTTASPAGRTTSPVVRTTSPVVRTTSPAVRTASPAGRTTSPAVRTASPAVRTTSPVGQNGENWILTERGSPSRSSVVVECVLIFSKHPAWAEWLRVAATRSGRIVVGQTFLSAGVGDFPVARGYNGQESLPDGFVGAKGGEGWHGGV